jgi:hypothetical protein
MEVCLWNGIRDTLSIPAKQLSNPSALKPSAGKASTSKRRIRKELYWTVLVLVISLAVGLSFATVGSYWIINRTIGRVHEIGLNRLPTGHEIEERLMSVAQTLSTPSNVNASHAKFQELMFSLGWLTAARVERLGALSKELQDALVAQKRLQRYASGRH